MTENKSSIAEAEPYQAIEDYWDEHNSSKVCGENEDITFQVDLASDVFYYAVETSHSSKLHLVAKEKGVSTEILINLWLQEKVNQEVTKN